MSARGSLNLAPKSAAFPLFVFLVPVLGSFVSGREKLLSEDTDRRLVSRVGRL